MNDILQVALIAMTPLAEAQVAVPFAHLHLAMPWAQAVLACLVGSVSLAFVLPFFLSGGEKLLQRFSWMKKVQDWLRTHVEKRFTEKYRTWGWIGLCVFVAIPGPGSGVWTGALAGWLLRYRYRETASALAIGAVLAAVSVALIASGAGGLIRFFAG